jgi:hypothetical protein
MRYKSGWKRFSDKEVSKIALFIEKAFPDGAVTPKALVEVARDAKSPIHQYFEWNDEVAAEKYRLYQARTLIKCIYIKESNGTEIRKYHNVYLEKDDREYVEHNRVMEAPDLWSQVLGKALAEATMWQKRYQTYRELEPIFTAIEQTGKELKHGEKERSRSNEE